MRGAHSVIRSWITVITMHFPTENNTPSPGRAKTASKDFIPTTAKELQALKTDVAASEHQSLAEEKGTGMKMTQGDKPLRTAELC